jgi:small-conductance mechanosensitive channel
VHFLSAATLFKIAATAGVVIAWLAVRWALRKLEDRLRESASRRTIWSWKALTIAVGAVAIIAAAGIWFEDGGHLATFSGIVVGGIAFASQKLFQSLAGFLVIVFGRTFDLGERIEMGGVRGDVLDIGLLKTTVMEMGVPDEQQPDPKHWVGGRQYSGRIVTLTNDAVFEKPVFNYSRNFDFLWEEMRIPIKYGADLAAAERILVEAARAEVGDLGREARAHMEKLRNRTLLADATFDPEVYVRLTDNWIELSLRFPCKPHGIRVMKSKISRRILQAFLERDIEVASSTFEVVGLPKLQVDEESAEQPAEQSH